MGVDRRGGGKGEGEKGRGMGKIYGSIKTKRIIVGTLLLPRSYPKSLACLTLLNPIENFLGIIFQVQKPRSERQKDRHRSHSADDRDGT